MLAVGQGIARITREWREGSQARPDTRALSAAARFIQTRECAARAVRAYMSGYAGANPLAAYGIRLTLFVRLLHPVLGGTTLNPPGPDRRLRQNGACERGPPL